MTDPAVALFSRLATSFAQRKNELDDLGALAGNPGYGVATANAFARAAEAVAASGDTEFGALLVAGSRALKPETEPLLGLVFLELGRACKRDTGLSLGALKEGLRNAVTSLVRVGGARFGDGTLLDALLPVSEAVHSAEDLTAALEQGARAAKESLARTRPTRPSALTTALIVEALAETFA